MPSDTITVVTVTCFSERVIGNWLARLPGDHPAIVTDNCSQDATKDIVRASGRATLIANDVNVGFGTATNQGLLQGDSDFVLMLNPDAQLRPGSLDHLLAAAQRYPEAGILAPVLRTPQDAWEVSHDVDMFRRQDLPSRRNDPEPVGDLCADFVSGAAMLVRRTALQQVGGFDPAIFLYYEDDDFCLRMRRAGWSLIRVADAMADHVGGGSVRRSLRNHWVKYWHFGWSRLYIEKKYNGTAAMLRIAIPALLRFGTKALFYFVTDYRNKGLRDAARFCGSLAYLIGMKSRR